MKGIVIFHLFIKDMPVDFGLLMIFPAFSPDSRIDIYSIFKLIFNRCLHNTVVR